MATMTARIAQITGSALTGLEPRVRVTLPEGGAWDESVIVDRPAPVIPDNTTGAFSVNLVPSMYGVDLLIYGLEVDWLDSAGNFVSLYKWPYKFTVPPEGGVITDNITSGSNFFQVEVSTVEPVELGGPQLVWFDPETDDVILLEEF